MDKILHVLAKEPRMRNRTNVTIRPHIGRLEFSQHSEWDNTTSTLAVRRVVPSGSDSAEVQLSLEIVVHGRKQTRTMLGEIVLSEKDADTLVRAIKTKQPRIRGHESFPDQNNRLRKLYKLDR